MVLENDPRHAIHNESIQRVKIWFAPVGDPMLQHLHTPRHFGFFRDGETVKIAHPDRAFQDRILPMPLYAGDKISFPVSARAASELQLNELCEGPIDWFFGRWFCSVPWDQGGKPANLIKPPPGIET
jgi:hypothetical protein